MTPLRAAVVIDYQNVHLIGANLFEPYKPVHECLVHPLHFANRLISIRNQRQRAGMPDATLTKVLVYRGLPNANFDPKPYARNQAQKTEWERDARVVVTLRPLKYEYLRAADGSRASDTNGLPIVTGRVEKGVDVLCALALVRESQDPNIDLVILASQDTDLEPALDEAINLGTAKIETASWFDPRQRSSREIRPSLQNIWNTRLDSGAFMASNDTTNYN